MSKKLSICNDALQPVQQPLEAIENLILNIRGRIESIEHHQLIMLEFVSLRSLSLSKGCRRVENF